MRTRIALVAVFTVAIINTICATALIRTVSSQAAAASPTASSTHASSNPSASALVAFTSLDTSGLRHNTIFGLGALLSLDAQILAAASTVHATPLVAAPEPEPASRPLVEPGPAQLVVPVTNGTSTATSSWNCIRVHESGNRYNDPSAPSGAYGIIPVTWNSNGYSGWPYQAAPETQDALALKLYHQYGWQPWSTRFACGL